MPDGHNHDEWKKEKDAKVKAWKDKRRAKTDKDGASKPSDKGTTSQPNKLTLSNRLTTALTTKLGVSDSDAKKLIKEAMTDSGKE